MSAESTIVFYGIRYEVPVERLEELETNSHPLIKKARSAGLDFYGGNFAEPDERYYLFVGKKVGILGAENVAEVMVKDQQLLEIVKVTRQKLSAAEVEGEPQLYVQWMPDAS